MNKRWYVALGVLVLVGLVVVSQTLPIRAWLLAAVEWTDRLGFVGALVFGGLYIVATVVVIPGAILTMGAGYLWGVLWGTILISVASTLGAVLAFVLGRSIARERVRRWARDAEQSDRIHALDRAIEQEGFKVVFLLRLVPVIPFNVLNYLLGLTGVSFGRYVLASWVGMLPGTILYVYIGAAAGRLTELAASGGGEVPTYRYILFGAGMVAVIVLVTTVTRRARSELDRLAESDDVELELEQGEAEE
jgi:uncharacterized membrane protein YdjX (TVP38/TMEM64 family)